MAAISDRRDRSQHAIGGTRSPIKFWEAVTTGSLIPTQIFEVVLENGATSYTVKFDRQRFRLRIVTDTDGAVSAYIVSHCDDSNCMSVNKAQAEQLLQLWRKNGVRVQSSGGQMPHDAANGGVVVGVPAKLAA